MVIVAQLVRAPVCGSGGRGFKSRLLPCFKSQFLGTGFFCFTTIAQYKHLVISSTHLPPNTGL
jgi:hypothetical protein